MAPPLIQVQNLSYRYGTNEPILENIDLMVSPGDYLGIIGPNGSGKTTFLKLLLGLLPLQSGSVALLGQPSSMVEAQGKIGYVPQSIFQNDLNFPATVSEVVESGNHLSNKPFQHYKLEQCLPLQQAVATVGIAHLLRERIGKVSGGERQRTFIARALISKPALLILDEPTAGIDVAGEVAFYALLKKLNEEQGITVVLVSHDLEALAHNAKTALCLNRRVIYSGAASGLHEKTVVETVFGRQAWHALSQNNSEK